MSEKKTRIVNVHQQLTCGEQQCTTVIVDGNTRATVATEQGDGKGSSKSLAALTAQKGASSCPATLGFTLFLTCTAPTPVSDRLTRARNRNADRPIMVALYSLITASFVQTRNLSLKWRKGQNNRVAQRGPQH